jgi:hypothetical protein
MLWTAAHRRATLIQVLGDPHHAEGLVLVESMNSMCIALIDRRQQKE